jgi:CRISPR/Cas system CSM-associated protein Csm2 small subunit
MGKETKTHRHNSIRQKIKRHVKIEKLRARYLLADSKGRDAIIQKLKKVNATLKVEEKPN